MRQDTSKSNRSANQRIQFLISSDGELEMAGGDALDFQVFGGVAGEFEDFGGEVFKDGGDVDGGWRGGVVYVSFEWCEDNFDEGGALWRGKGKWGDSGGKGLVAYLWHRRASCSVCCSSEIA